MKPHRKERAEPAIKEVALVAARTVKAQKLEVWTKATAFFKGFLEGAKYRDRQVKN